MPAPIALQLFGVRDPLAERFEMTIKSLRKMGYRYVELAGYHGRRPERVHDILRKNDMRAMSAHVGFDQLKDSMGTVCAEMKLIGVRHVVCPSLPEYYRDEDGYREAADCFMEFGRKLAISGFTFSHHNHAYELEDLGDGTTGMDIILQRTEPKYVHWECDVYWVEKAGQSAAEWLKKYADRISLAHIKDMRDSEKKGFAELGAGTLDLKKILRAARDAKVEAYIIEQDAHWTVSPMDSARVSYEYLEPMVKRL